MELKMNSDRIIALISVIIAIISIALAIYIYVDSSNQILDLEDQLNNAMSELNNTYKELLIVENEINNTRIELFNAKNEILLAIYEVESFGLDDQSKEKFFQNKFGFSYEQAKSILNYLSKTDDYDLAFKNLMYGDHETGLYHFEMALIKDPINKEAKIGKAISLIGLNRTYEARNVLFEVENEYKDKRYIYWLIGDSYYIEENYYNCTEYYINSLEFFFIEQGPKDIQGLDILTDTCEIEATGKFDSPWISITNQSDGWKICEVILEDAGCAINTRYKVNYT